MDESRYIGTACKNHGLRIIGMELIGGTVTLQHGENPEHRADLAMDGVAVDAWLELIHAREAGRVQQA